MELVQVLRDELNNFLNQYGDILNGHNVIVGVSTGVDSTTLLHTLEEVKDEYGFKIVIAHINHGKREQSLVEEEYIKEYAFSKNIDIEILKLLDSDFSGANFQEEARLKRIEFFKKVSEKYDTNIVFLAHHANDDAETIIMRLMRDSSLNGIYGMNKVSFVKGTYFIRPFLDVLKKDIYIHARKNGYVYYEDYTNQLDHYTRNQVRHNLIDSTFGGDVDLNALKRYKKNIQEFIDIYNGNRDAFINNNVIIKEDEIKININDLNKLSTDELIDVLFESLKKYNFSKVNILEIIKIIDNVENKVVPFKSYLIFKEYNQLIIKDNNENNLASNSDNLIILDGMGKHNVDDKHFVEMKEITKEEIKTKINISNLDILCYNLNMLPLKIRFKQDGDRIRIKNGSKKVNDVLTDKKIKASLRNKIRVILDKDDNILAILGVKKSYLLNECSEMNLLIKTNYYNNL